MHRSRCATQPEPPTAPESDLKPLSVVEIGGCLDSYGRRMFVATDEQGREILRGVAGDDDEAGKTKIRAQLAEYIEAYLERPRLAIVRDA